MPYYAERCNTGAYMCMALIICTLIVIEVACGFMHVDILTLIFNTTQYIYIMLIFSI